MREESLIGGEVNLIFRLEKLANSLGELCCVSQNSEGKPTRTLCKTFA
jgi:hypothetical protein